jgi:hypothetical protein
MISKSLKKRLERLEAICWPLIIGVIHEGDEDKRFIRVNGVDMPIKEYEIYPNKMTVTIVRENRKPTDADL